MVRLHIVHIMFIFLGSDLSGFGKVFKEFIDKDGRAVKCRVERGMSVFFREWGYLLHFFGD